MPKSSYQPSVEKRNLVKTLAGLGLRHHEICPHIGLRSPKTLRRYYASELALGIAESTVNVLKTSFRLASSGKDPAMTKFFLKTRGRWSATMSVNAEAELDERLIYLYEDYTVAAISEQPENSN
jgi:hypothetical protein